MEGEAKQAAFAARGDDRVDVEKRAGRATVNDFHVAVSLCNEDSAVTGVRDEHRLVEAALDKRQKGLTLRRWHR
jgi:hypothetical protein